MLVQGDTAKVARHHRFAVPQHLDPHAAFPASPLLNPGIRDEPLPHHNRLQEADIRSSEHNMGMIDGQHRRIVGEAEDKSAMDEAALIRGHFR
jgi:hypothetical protein